MKESQCTTMCIMHSTLRDATTPYTERYALFLFLVDGQKVSEEKITVIR